MTKTERLEWVELTVMACLAIGLAHFYAGLGRPISVSMVLVMSVLVVSIGLKRPFSSVGLCWRGRWRGIGDLVAACGVSAVVLFCLQMAAKRTGMGWLLPVVVPSGDKLFWVLSQFFQVAFCEELFFRGYVQGRIKSLLGLRCVGRDRLLLIASVAMSAGVFSIAHCAVWGHWAGLMTFFPGLVLGWLFWRTGCLLEPILYHGLANVGYVMLLSRGST